MTRSRPSVAIHVTKKHTVAAPNRIQPGTVQLRNTGSHPIYVLRKGRYGLTTLVADLNATGAGPGRLIKDFTLRDLIDAHTDVYLRLGRGTYYLANADASTYQTWKVHTLIVSGKTRNAPLPASNLIDLDRRGVLHTGSALTQRYLHVQNDSGALQEVMLFAIGSHTTDAQLAAFVANPSYDKLFDLDVRTFYLGALVAAHHSAWVNPHLRAGRYLMLDQSFTAHTEYPTLYRSHVKAVTVK